MMELSFVLSVYHFWMDFQSILKVDTFSAIFTLENDQLTILGTPRAIVNVYYTYNSRVSVCFPVVNVYTIRVIGSTLFYFELLSIFLSLPSALLHLFAEITSTSLCT